MRVIPCRVTDEYVQGAGVMAGAAGSHDDVALRLTFGAMWTGTARSIVWKNARGGNATVTLLTANLLEEGEEEIYLVPIPAEAKEYAGEMSVSIKGATVSGETESSATLTATAYFTVLESDWDEDAEESGDVNATQAEQLQAEIEGVKSDIVKTSAAVNAAEGYANDAKEQADAARIEADKAAESEENAAQSKENAGESALDAEAWAVGKRNGEDVSSSDAAYQNNAKYYSEKARDIAGGDFATKAEAQSYVAQHATNSTLHITAAERAGWNANGENLSAHTSNGAVHVTASDKSKWSGKAAGGVSITFDAAAWSGSSGAFTLTISQATHKRESSNFIFAVYSLCSDGTYAKNTWDVLELDTEYTASTGAFKLYSDTAFAGKITFLG